MADIHIVVDKLFFSYNRKEKVLENISFTVKKNEIITIIGPNGGGKSTLLRLLMGFMEPDSGTIRIDSKAPLEYMGNIGYVPQHASFDKQFPMTVSDVVMTGLLRSFGFFSKKDRVLTEKALDNVGLLAEKNNHIGELSGGQTQRMLIARALVSEKEILLLDEPTSNIDPAAGKHINTLLKELNKKQTIILVTHDTGFVSNITDRVFCVNKSLVEHPIDENFSEIIASAYGSHSSIVRHDMTLPEQSSMVKQND